MNPWTLARFKPAAPKYLLLTLAGALWSMVGLMLCRLAVIWLAPLPSADAAMHLAAGGVFAFAAHCFAFSGIARKNINRLCRITDKACIFAFQAWKSYLIVVAMIAMGILLRQSSIPRPLLAIVYCTIGGALFLSSLLYYRCLWRVLLQKKSCHAAQNGPDH